MSRTLRLPFLLFILLGCFVWPVQGQDKPIDIYLIYLPDKDQHYVYVVFAKDLTKDPTEKQITLVTKKANGSISQALNVTHVDLIGGTSDQLEVEFALSPGPEPDDTEVVAVFTDLVFGSETQKITGTGPIYNAANLSKLGEKTAKAQNEAADKGKTTEEKNIFTGFSVAAPSNGNAEGNGEIHLNKWLSPDFFVSLHAKKSSTNEADPKHFDVSLTYRRAFLFGGQALTKANNAIDAFLKDPTNVEEKKNMQNSLKELQDKILLGLLIDAAGHLEGEALNFNVTNAVLDLPLQLVSRTKNVSGDNAYFFFRAVAGVELGRNLRTENEAVKKYYIGRFKYGGELNFVYDPKNPETAFPKRIQLTAQAIDRYLFRKETFFDPKTMKATVFSKGHKPWYQFDLKVYLGESKQGRFGFRVSRIRGGLPPTFNDTRAFTFGAIFESAEDKNK